MPLYKAVVRGYTSVARVLIEAGAEPNNRGPSGITPLWTAALEGHKDIVTMLLHAKANPLLAEEDLLSLPLDAAARHGHVDVVLDLIQHVGIEGCGGASGGIDALCLASVLGEVGIMAILVDAGVVDTGQALCTAAMFGCEGSVKFLLQEQQGKRWATSCRGGYVHTADLHGRTPLSCSIDSCSPRVVRRLLDAGADTTTGIHVSHEVGAVTYTTRYIGALTEDGNDDNEEMLHRLESIRRMLLQVNAVHAVSWLWFRGMAYVGANGTERIRRTKKAAAGTPLKLMLPTWRRRAGRRGVLLAALWRYSAKGCDESAAECQDTPCPRQLA